MNDDYGVSMTREAKIGLLVALAFLLVIGILLSDHVTTATRQPQATLAGVQSNIRDGLAAPGANAPAPQSGALPVLPDQPPADPGRPFTLNQAQPANGQVEVQRGVPENGDIPRGGQVSGVDPWINTQAPEQIIGPGMLDARDALARQATLGGEPIAPADARPQPQQGGAGEYVVQPGDVLSKITAKFFGRDNADNREALYALNPALRANPNKLSVGDKIRVPTGPGTAPQQAAATPARRTPRESAPGNPPRQAQAPAPTPRQATPSKVYTVKKGDTLWSIALKHLGDGKRQAEILKLNAGSISDPDDIKVGMKLKLPG